MREIRLGTEGLARNCIQLLRARLCAQTRELSEECACGSAPSELLWGGELMGGMRASQEQLA
eukprot:15434173-Alexandrium_andersonii.AAC.1